jgi:hypothetical protein
VRRRLVLASIVVVLLALLGYALSWPCWIRPVAWTPDRDPGLTGIYAPNEALAKVSVGDNYPNPFSAHTAVDVVLGHDSAVTIELFDAAGRRVRSIDAGRLSAGALQLTFEALDDRGYSLPSGVYFYRVHANDAMVTRKLVITR